MPRSYDGGHDPYQKAASFERGAPPGMKMGCGIVLMLASVVVPGWFLSLSMNDWARYLFAGVAFAFMSMWIVFGLILFLAGLIEWKAGNA